MKHVMNNFEHFLRTKTNTATEKEPESFFVALEKKTLDRTKYILPKSEIIGHVSWHYWATAASMAIIMAISVLFINNTPTIEAQEVASVMYQYDITDEDILSQMPSSSIRKSSYINEEALEEIPEDMIIQDL